MKYRKAAHIIIIIIFVIIFAVPSILYWVYGKSFQKKVSMTKQSLTEEYENKFRQGPFEKISEFLTPAWYKESIKEVDRVDPLLVGVPSAPKDLPYLAPVLNIGIICGRDGWLFTTNSNALEYYLGNNVPTMDQMESWRIKIDRLQNIMNKKGIKFAVMICPNKEQVYPEFMPSYQITTPYKRQIIFEKYMHENSTSNYFYPIRELAAPKGFYETYWQTDTHWNQAGALIGVSLLYHAFGMKLNQKDIEMVVKETTAGDMAFILGSRTPYADFTVNYKPNINLNCEEWEGTVDIDVYGKTYTSTNKNGKKLVVCGDSYRVASSAIMAKDFETTHVFHRVLVNSWGNEKALDIMKNLKEGDTLAIIGVERWDNEIFDLIDFLGNFYS